MNSKYDICTKMKYFLSQKMGIIRKNKINIIFLITLILIPITIFRILLIEQGHVFHEDSAFPWNHTLLDVAISQFFSSWDPYTLLGEHHVLRAEFPAITLIYFLHLFVNSVPVAVKLLYIITLAVSAISMYALIYSLQRDSLSAFISSLFYILNPWVFDRFLSGHFNVLTAYSLVPIALLTIIKVNKKKITLANSLLTSLLCGFILRANWHIGIFLIFILIAFRTYRILLNKPDFKRILNEGITIFFILGLIILINLDWLPYTLWHGPEFIGGYYPPIEEFYALSKNSDILNVLMFNSYWAQSVEKLFVDIFGSGLLYSFWQLSPFILLTLSLLPLVKRKMHNQQIGKIYYFFALTFLCGVILSNGAKAPFGELNVWLFQNVPFFSIFRDPNKFVYLMILSVSVMLGVSVSVLKGAIRIGKFRLSFRKIVTFLAISSIFLNSGVVLINLKPSTADRIAIQTVVFPKEYEELYNFLKSDPDYPNYRIAILPPYVTMENFSWSELYVHNPLRTVPIVPFIIVDDVRNPSFVNDYAWHVFRLVYTNKTTKIGSLFAPLSVKYFIVQEDAEPPPLSNTQVFLSKDETKILNAQEDLTLVYSEGTIKIYRNLAYFPKITATVKPLIAATDRRGQTFIFQHLSKDLIFPDRNFMPILLNLTHYLFIQEEYKLDILFSLLDQKYVINLHELARRTEDAENNWIAGEYSNFILGLKEVGDLDFTLNKFIYTRGRASVKVSIKIDEPGEYEIWLNKYVGSETGILLLRIGNKELTIYDNDDENVKFTWVNCGNITLERKEYEIEILSDGPNAISKMAIVPKYVLENANRYLENIFEDKTIIYLEKDVNINNISPFLQLGKNIFAYQIERVISSSSYYNITWNLTEVSNFHFEPVNVDYTYNINKDVLLVNCFFDGPPQEDEFLVIKRPLPGIDLMTYPFLSLTYRVEFPDTQIVEIGFDIDFTGDGKPDTTVWLFETASSSDWHTFQVDLYKHARKEQPNAGEYKLVSVNILLHKIWGIDASGEKKGMYPFYLKTLQMMPNVVANVTKRIRLYTSGVYDLWIHACGSEENQSLRVEILGNELTSPLNKTLKWTFLGTLNIEKGFHEITLKSNGTVKVIEMILTSKENHDNDFDYLGEPEITFKMLAPYKYVVNIKTASPFFLFFSETYHDGWKVFIDGKELSDKYHFVLNGFANGWYINQTGRFTILLEYTPQRVYDFGIKVSLFIVITFPTFVMYVSIIKRKDSWNKWVRKQLKDHNPFDIVCGSS